VIDGFHVVDAVVHPYNLTAENERTPHARWITKMLSGANHASSSPGYRLPQEVYESNWSIEDVASMSFVESHADLAAYHIVPIRAYYDGICSIEKCVEAKERWPQRFVFYAGVDPLEGNRAIEDLEQQVEMLDGPTGLKLYPNSWVGNEMTGWAMDDPEVAFPVFQHAQELGIKVVAIHKALPLGPVEMKHYAVTDIDRAAMAFPDLQFEIVHGGMAFLEETAWQVARFNNVWINLESTATMLTTRPRAFEQVLATFVGRTRKAYDRLLWGTGAMVTHPRPHLERFVREFRFSDELIEGWGVPQITDEFKAKILGRNYATLHGFDLEERVTAVKDDVFSRRRAEFAETPPGYSTTAAAQYAF
jgi:predicted TIM-barrel fold metal-dependent hydrolase